MTVSQYCFNVLIAIDQLANTILGGYPDETISSRVYRYSEINRCARIMRVLLDFLFRPWGRDHCKQAYESELERNHLFETKGVKRVFARR